MEVCDGGRENPSSPDWAWVQGEVGDNPFMALANGFKTALAKHDQRLRDVVAALSEDPGVLPRLAQALIDARLLVASQGEAVQPVVMLWSMPGGFLPGPASLIGYRRRRNGNTPAGRGNETQYCYDGEEARLGDYAWYSENAEGRNHPVERKRANAWGLYDRHGNVYEWVQDWYERYSEDAQHNPSGAESGSDRVVRGGSWSNDAGGCRSAFRSDWHPGFRYGDLGFRLARRV